MSDFTIEELSEAHRSLLSTLCKCEKVLESSKLPQAQRTLTKRRVSALKIALTLIEGEQANMKVPPPCAARGQGGNRCIGKQV